MNFSSLRRRAWITKLCLMMLGSIPFILSTEQSASAVTSRNRFVRVDVQEGSGRIDIFRAKESINWVTNPQDSQLTFIQHSYLTVRLDANDGNGWRYYTNNEIGFSDPGFAGHLQNATVTKVGDTIVATWKLPIGEIIQQAYPVLIKDCGIAIAGQVVMRFFFRNLKNGPFINAQARFVLDTRVSSDKSRVLTANGLSRAWSYYPVHAPVPIFFQSFLPVPPDARTLIGEGYFEDELLGLMKPDAVVVGDWDPLTAEMWFPVSPQRGGNYGDSAVLFEWGVKGAGGTDQTRYVELGSTSYGTQSLLACYGNLYALVYRPREIKLRKAPVGLYPNPFDVQMYLFNVDPTRQAEGVRATMTLGQNLHFVTGAASQSPTPSAIPLSGVSVAQWKLRIDSLPCTDRATLDFQVRAFIGDSLYDPVFATSEGACRLKVCFECLKPDTTKPSSSGALNDPLSDQVDSLKFVKQIRLHDNNMKAEPPDWGIDTLILIQQPARPDKFVIEEFNYDPTDSCSHDTIKIRIKQLDSTICGTYIFKVVDCAGNIRIDSIPFPCYPVDPDTVAPRVTFTKLEGVFKGAGPCNAKRITILAADDNVHDLHLKSIKKKSAVNMDMQLDPLVQAPPTHTFSVFVIDSMVDGEILLELTDVANNVTDTLIKYCTIRDTIAPRITPVVNGALPGWTFYIEEDFAWDRLLDSVEVTLTNAALVNPIVRTDYAGKNNYSFEVKILDVNVTAEVCVRAKDQMSASGNWSEKVCVRKPIDPDPDAPGFGFDANISNKSTRFIIEVRDLHYCPTAPTVCDYDRGMDSVWFDAVNVNTPLAKRYGCAISTGPLNFSVADSSLPANLCIHALDCWGNRSDTCWSYVPNRPDPVLDLAAPQMAPLAAECIGLSFRVADSTQNDFGLKSIRLESADNFDPVNLTLSADRGVTVGLRPTSSARSAKGRLVAFDVAGDSSANQAYREAHSAYVDVAIWRQDLEMPPSKLAEQNSEITIPISISATDAYRVVEKEISSFSIEFDLSGDLDLAFNRVENQGTATQGWTMNPPVTNTTGNITHVTISGSTTGLVLDDATSSTLLNVIVNAGPNELTKNAVIDNLTVTFNGGATKTVQGHNATAQIPAPCGSVRGTSIAARGSCSPSIVNHDAPQAAMISVRPNPFKRATEMTVQVPAEALVNLTLYNALGSPVATLINEQMTPGSYKMNYTAQGLPAGSYYLRYQTKDKVITRKLVIDR